MIQYSRHQYISIKEVEEIIGQSRLTIKAWIREHKFPKPRRMNFRSVWDIETIRNWLRRNP